MDDSWRGDDELAGIVDERAVSEAASELDFRSSFEFDDDDGDASEIGIDDGSAASELEDEFRGKADEDEDGFCSQDGNECGN